LSAIIYAVMPLSHDTSHRIAIKGAIEEVLGKDAWYELKETTALAPWRKNVLKVLKAIRLSLAASVHVRDQGWSEEVECNLLRGEEGVKASTDIDELLSCFEATLVRLVFLQIGFAPNFKGHPGLPLRKENWSLDTYRSVQYVQAAEQLEALFWSEQQRRIGFEKQMELRDEHRRSRSKVPYSVWCRQREAQPAA